MYNKDEIEDSLEFCHDIQLFYEEGEKNLVNSIYQSKKEEMDTNQFTANQRPVLQTEVSSVFTILKYICKIALCVLLALILSKLITRYIGNYTTVNGNSMQDTLHNKDGLIIDRLTYHWNAPRRFDIVVFPHEKDVYYIKRVIGLPGETIQIKENRIYINGRILPDTYEKEDMDENGLASKKIKLSKDEYFVMGDNRNHSVDSRFAEVGNVKRKEIVGKAWIRIYPFRDFGILK